MADAITAFVDPACGDDRDLDQTARRGLVIAQFVRNLFNGQIRYAHDYFFSFFQGQISSNIASHRKASASK